LLRTLDGEPGLNYLCSGLRRFFKHALPEVERIASSIRRQETGDRKTPRHGSRLQLCLRNHSGLADYMSRSLDR
jgi:hypothetical protein